MAAGSHYTDEQRGQAVIAYAVTGNMNKVSADLGIPKTTVQGWRHADWFVEQLEQVRAENADKFAAKAQAIIERATDRTLDTIDDASAREAATIGAIYYDKLRLALNQPTSIRGDTGGVQALAKQFADLSAQWREKQANVVATIEHDPKKPQTEE